MTELQEFDRALVECGLGIARKAFALPTLEMTEIYTACATEFAEKLAGLDVPPWLIAAIVERLGEVVVAEIERLEQSAAFLATVEVEGRA